MLRPVSLRACWVFPVAGPPISGGWLTVDSERILAVGKLPEPGAEQRDLGEVALLPGLINAHAHLEFSLLAKPLGQRGQRLPDWIREVLAYRRTSGLDRAAAIQAGIAESRQQGVAAIGEIATGDWQRDWYATFNLHEAAPRLTLFHELIGFSPSVQQEKTREAEQRLASPAGDNRNIAAGLSPHAPYTVSPGLVRSLAQLAGRIGVPLAMHLAESPEELELLAAGTGPFRTLLQDAGVWDAGVIPLGTTPGDYLQALVEGAAVKGRSPRVLAVHGNYFSSAEVALAAEHFDRLSVVYCPRTHAYFEHAPYPLAAMLAAGVRVVLGTDGRSSNPNLSILAEIRHAAANHAISPSVALALATRDAAYALGWEAQLGTLEPGKQAQCCCLQLPASLANSNDPHELLLDEGATIVPMHNN